MRQTSPGGEARVWVRRLQRWRGWVGIGLGSGSGGALFLFFFPPKNGSRWGRCPPSRRGPSLGEKAAAVGLLELQEIWSSRGAVDEADSPRRRGSSLGEKAAALGLLELQ